MLKLAVLILAITVQIANAEGIETMSREAERNAAIWENTQLGSILSIGMYLFLVPKVLVSAGPSGRTV